MSFHKRREKYKKKRKLKKRKGGYTLRDFFSDVLFYFPEIILFPFRMLLYEGNGDGTTLTYKYSHPI